MLVPKLELRKGEKRLTGETDVREKLPYIPLLSINQGRGGRGWGSPVSSLGTYVVPVTRGLWKVS